MRRSLFLPVSLLFLSGCVATLPMDRDELSEARAAVEAARAAGAENCAPDELSDAQAALYHAAHELSEGDVHPDEQAGLIARAIQRAEDAIARTREACAPKPKPEIISLPGVNFETDSADITAESAAILDKAAETLLKKPSIRAEVAAHTDSDGSEAYNEALSLRRAKSVLDYLVSKGVSAERLVPRGYGETDPVASNDTPEGKARNRRVELRILSK